MLLKLKDIATVSSGVTFRSRIKTSVDGNVRIIQMKDLGSDNSVHLENLMQIDYIKPRSNQLVKHGDIIFRSRGLTSTAALLLEDSENTIVAAPLFQIRPNISKVIPAFLLWWINQSSSQAYFWSRSEGTMIKMISKRELENLEVRLPSLAQQNKIAEFFNLAMQEQQLLEKIRQCKAICTQGILMQIVSTLTNDAQGADQ